MPRPATGQVVERTTRAGDTSYSLRFPVRGHGRQFQLLGYRSQGWTRERAETELANVMADVRRGIWEPPAPPEPEPERVPTFHEFASLWFETQKLEGGARGRGLSPKGVADLEWRLTRHLLPYFVKTLGNPRLDAITVADVDRYRHAKVKAGRLGPVSINKTLATLSAILEQALEYGHVDRNVAKGKRRRLKQGKPARPILDRADHIAALLDAAGVLDARARQCRGQRRVLLSTLTFAGLRIGEALALRWGDVNLGRGTIMVRESKTDAGVRTVNIVPVLRDELATYRAGLGDVDPGALVFATSTGAAQGESNVRRRLLAAAVEIANERLVTAGEDPITVRLTPHSLRRTYASLLFAIGEDAPYVMAQMGHTTPHLTLEVYARAMQRRDGEKERLAALVRGDVWAPIGHSDVPRPVLRDAGRAA